MFILSLLKYCLTHILKSPSKMELLRLEVNLRKCKGEGYYTSPFIEDFFFSRKYLFNLPFSQPSLCPWYMSS